MSLKYLAIIIQLNRMFNFTILRENLNKSTFFLFQRYSLCFVSFPRLPFCRVNEKVKFQVPLKVLSDLLTVHGGRMEQRGRARCGRAALSGRRRAQGLWRAGEEGWKARLQRRDGRNRSRGGFDWHWDRR